VAVMTHAETGEPSGSRKYPHVQRIQGERRRSFPRDQTNRADRIERNFRRNPTLENKQLKGDGNVTQYQSGADALNALNATNESGSGMEFTSFKTGTTLAVKVLGSADLITFFSYGVFKVVNSFVAKEPSKKSANGYPVDNLTVWDKAWKYHKDLSKEFNDHHGQEASKYRASQRFAMGFFDLTSGEPIIVDVSKNQAQAIHAVIKRNEKRLADMSFELSKQGSGTSTTVSLTPIMYPEEDLTDAQRANLGKAPESFDMKLFEGLLFEADEAEQITNLITAGFDISLIGLERPAAGGSEGNPVDNTQVAESDLPF